MEKKIVLVVLLYFLNGGNGISLDPDTGLNLVRTLYTFFFINRDSP